jgi:hypothetical protein
MRESKGWLIVFALYGGIIKMKGLTDINCLCDLVYATQSEFGFVGFMDLLDFSLEFLNDRFFIFFLNPENP